MHARSPSDAAGTSAVSLRGVLDSDLPLFFGHQRDPVASQMAAFTVRDPADRGAFESRWIRIRGDASITIKTILAGEEVAGHILSFQAGAQREISYWIGSAYWGRGIATSALTAFLDVDATRPLYARVVNDNAGSRRVLEKCGFTVIGQDHGFANARGTDVDEFILTRWV